MIDPIILTIHLGGLTFSIHWYAVFIIGSIIVAAWLTAREVARRGGDAEDVWDGLTWATLGGIVGARVWYVVNDILGGGSRYLEEPLSMLYVFEGGLHFYGAMLFGAIAVYVFVRRRKLDMWLVLDSVAPTLLISQGLARPANFINQELYGPPTDLPWGIRITAANRIPPWNNIGLFPEDTTRFHPTFAYEMIWNIVTGGLLLWAARKYSKKLKPGAVFAAWLVLAGVGRVIIESFRPDQPVVPGTALSYTRIVSALMAVVGVLMLLVRYRVLKPSFLPAWAESYRVVAAAPEGPEPVGEDLPPLGK